LQPQVVRIRNKVCAKYLAHCSMQRPRLWDD